jgi:hypothetical protein
MSKAVTSYPAFPSKIEIAPVGRTELLDRQHPPTRVWTADLRLPMMHRAGWTGKRASSNTAYSWVIWDERANAREFPRRFNWREICALPEWEGWL